MNNLKSNGCKSFKGTPSKEEEEGQYQVDLIYDLVPCNFISLVVTELELMPPTGVPVYLKELKRDEFY